MPGTTATLALLLHFHLSAAGGLAAPLREHRIPYLSACSTRSATQAWQIEVATANASRVRLGTSSTCLCAYSAVAEDNPRLGPHQLHAAVLLPCDTHESADISCRWLVGKHGPNKTLTFAAALELTQLASSAESTVTATLPTTETPPLDKCSGPAGTATALDWYGQNIAEVSGTTSNAKCCEACAKHADCKYWTRANSTRSGGPVGRCYLKSSSTGRRTDNPGYVAGRMPGAPLPPIKPSPPPPPAPAPPGTHCLTAVHTFWPVPAWRNSVVQLGSQCTDWTQGPGDSLDAGGGMCLDGGTGPAAAPPARCCSNATAKELPFCNSSMPFASRARDLVERLTVDEIAGILTMGMPNSETRAGTTYINQRLTTPVPRLSLPGFEFSEACHGILSGCLAPSTHSSGCPTSFPMPIGQAASFNESLWHITATAISDEARALQNGGVNGVNFFAPNINVVRDPRWGRGYETAGEDALVNGRFAMQYVGGLQGHDRYLKAVATCKHSLLYDLETQRADRSSSATKKDLTDYFLVPFEFCIKRASVASIMCQYGANAGVPSCANGEVNNKLYRDTYKGDFFMVSDCDSAGGFTKHWANFTAVNSSQGVAEGMLGGLDVDCGTTYASIPEAVAEGLLTEKAVRQSAQRFLAKQIALGALEPSSPYESLGPDVVDSVKHRDLALQAAQQTLVLLRNEERPGDSAKRGLPLSSDATIAFIGPHCQSTVALLGNYHGVNVQVLNSSIVDMATTMGLDFTVSDGTGPFPSIAAQAKAADVAVLCLGLTVDDEGEGHDRSTLGLPPRQVDLAATVVSAQPYTVAVLVNGGALSIEPLITGAGAVVSVLEAFYPAQAGGMAIMQTLLGRSNRFGKLPYTMYPVGFENRSIGNYDLHSDGGLTYRYYNNKYGKPIFEFGHGLSYSSFEYEWATVPKARTTVADLKTTARQGCYDCSALKFDVKVTNTGSMAGDAVVLGFVARSGAASTSSRALFDFGRVSLDANASAVLTLRMDTGCTQAVSYVDDDGVRWVGAGTYTVTAGDLLSPASHTLTLSGTSAMIDPRCGA